MQACTQIVEIHVLAELSCLRNEIKPISGSDSFASHNSSAASGHTPRCLLRHAHRPLQAANHSDRSNCSPPLVAGRTPSGTSYHAVADDNWANLSISLSRASESLATTLRTPSVGRVQQVERAQTHCGVLPRLASFTIADIVSSATSLSATPPVANSTGKPWEQFNVLLGTGMCTLTLRRPCVQRGACSAA